MKDSGAILVHHVGHAAPVVGRLEVVDVPLDVGQEEGELARGEVQVGEAKELRTLVRGDIQALAIVSEAPPAVSDFVIAWRQQLTGAGIDIHEIEGSVIDGAALSHQKRLVVGGPVERRPAAALHLEQEPGMSRV